MQNPLKSAWHGLRYAIDRTFKTGNRRHEFEHKYRRHGDYFGYRTKPYEALKYARTLELMRAWRPSSESALEIGCSVGVFTAMIAPEFSHIVAVDIASEALCLAAEATGHMPHVSYIQSDLISLNAGRTFGVIFCAEVLYYIPHKQGPEVCQALDRHLAPDGVIIEVCQQDREAGAPKFFHGWDKVLGQYFEVAHLNKFDAQERPYEIVAYRRKTAPSR
jgi:2-polyprenyl-3-methyl-5-hydroxy-6-metoxy-1,4-benzoquinol methylase